MKKLLVLLVILLSFSSCSVAYQSRQLNKMTMKEYKKLQEKSNSGDNTYRPHYYRKYNIPYRSYRYNRWR
jgi:hypothetical protein